MVAWEELSSAVSVLVGPSKITCWKERKEMWCVEYAKLSICSCEFVVCTPIKMVVASSMVAYVEGTSSGIVCNCSLFL